MNVAMKGRGKFLAGLLVGLVVGTTSGAYAQSVLIATRNGYAIGWTVTVEGDEVCSDPYVYRGPKEIDCE